MLVVTLLSFLQIPTSTAYLLPSGHTCQQMTSQDTRWSTEYAAMTMLLVCLYIHYVKGKSDLFLVTVVMRMYIIIENALYSHVYCIMNKFVLLLLLCSISQSTQI